MKKIKYPKTTKNNFHINQKKFKKKRNYNKLEKESKENKKDFILNSKDLTENKFKEIKTQFDNTFPRTDIKRNYSLDKLIIKFDSIRIIDKLLNENKIN